MPRSREILTQILPKIEVAIRDVQKVVDELFDHPEVETLLPLLVPANLLANTHPGVASVAGIAPAEFDRLMVKAGEATTCWLLSKKMSAVPAMVLLGIPFEDRLRHDILFRVERAARKGDQPCPKVESVRLLCDELGVDFGPRLELRARFLAREGRFGFIGQPLPDDIRDVAQLIRQHFPDEITAVMAEEIAREVLHEVCLFIFELAKLTLPKSEFFVERVGSQFVSEVAFVRARHLILLKVQQLVPA